MKNWVSETIKLASQSAKKPQAQSLRKQISKVQGDQKIIHSVLFSVLSDIAWSAISNRVPTSIKHYLGPAQTAEKSSVTAKNELKATKCIAGRRSLKSNEYCMQRTRPDDMHIHFGSSIIIVDIRILSYILVYTTYHKITHLSVVTLKRRKFGDDIYQDRGAVAAEVIQAAGRHHFLKISRNVKEVQACLFQTPAIVLLS